MNRPPAQPVAPDRPVYTVTRLNQDARTLLEDRFGRIWVEGEIGNYSQPSSGHIYFTLKDGQAQVRCALFRMTQRLCCPAANGMQVLVCARVSLYEGRGEFQLIVEQMEDAGEGALRRAFEVLKRTLASEGLFEATAKQPLPRNVRRIGVITSPDGAVWHDILTTLKRRFPAIAVLLYGVPVQGKEAAPRIVEALDLANARAECDVLLLARGGGSLEDLWPFNEESVARAIFRSRLPVVAGIGHETDVTIADWVADVRAPTPTAAAELLSPDQGLWRERHQEARRRLQRLYERLLRERIQRLDDLKRRLSVSLLGLAQKRLAIAALDRRLKLALPSYQERLRTRLLTASQRLSRLSPTARLHAYRLRLAPLPGGLQAAIYSLLQNRRTRLVSLPPRLLSHHPGMALEQLRKDYGQLMERLLRATQATLTTRAERVAHMTRALQLIGPRSVLERGYAIVTDRDGHVITTSAHCATGDSLRVLLATGKLTVEVKTTYS
ncbi:MAG TPA: exodeoxyribonuclease VII large subunit [Acidiferrobacter sp.]|nr:exodeoxyribonuclease VII large subunit [Acidiferrobacter sp.]